MSFPDVLRCEYEAEVLDVSGRTRRAARVQAALLGAGLWPARARILDVGCGSGLLLNALGGDARLRVGCDMRRSLYLQARALTGRIVFVQCEGNRLPVRDGGFDLVMCLAVIEELSDWQGALEEMARCVAPGGVLYVTVTNGRLLLPLYGIAGRVGLRIPASWRAYARASLAVLGRPAEAGLGLRALAGWRSVDLTPHLARSQWPWLRAVPLFVLAFLLPRLAPSFGFVWQRPRVSAGSGARA